METLQTIPTGKKLSIKFSHVFGDEDSLCEVQDDDIISNMAFSLDGQFFAIGDAAGRLIIFEYQKSKKRKFRYQYLTEFQSHDKDFDYLKSKEIEERINKI